jgi:integrin beta 3/collagen type V/XI/XXIV/XXVII alpha
MSSQSQLSIKGSYPHKQSGVYEAKISITDSKPTDDAIRKKQFLSLWNGTFHLGVKDGIFSQILGSPDNPLPASNFTN